MGKKLDFLGWTLHLLTPNKINWLTDVAHSVSTRLKDRTKLYVYPSKNSISNFRNEIKYILSSAFVKTPINTMIKNINYVVWGWSNYFIPSPNQYALRKTLDQYVLKRCRKWIFRKFGAGSYAYYIRRYFQDDNNNWLSSMTITNPEKKTKLEVKRLAELNAPIPFMMIKPSDEIVNNSFYTNQESYIKRALLIGQIKDDLRSKLLITQKMKCGICNRKLISFNNILTWLQDNIMNQWQNSFTTQNSNLVLNQDYLALNDNDYKDRLRNNMRISLLNKYKGSTWHYGSAVDHIIPRSLSCNIPDLQAILFNEKMNLCILHNHCHKLKTNIDLTLLLKFYKQFKKDIKKLPDTKLLSKPDIELLALNKLLNNETIMSNYLTAIQTLYNAENNKKVNMVILKLKNIIQVQLKKRSLQDIIS